MDFLIFILNSCLDLKLGLGLGNSGAIENTLLITDGTNLLLTNSDTVLLAEE